MKNLKNYLYKLNKLTDASVKELVVIIFSFVISSLLDLIGIGLLSIYVTLLINPDLIVNSYIFTKYHFLSEITSLNQLANLVGSVLVILFVLKLFISIIIYNIVFKFTHSRQKLLRQKLLNSYKKLSYEKYIYRDSSDSIASIGVYVKNYGSVITGLLLFVSDMIIALFIAILLLSFNGPFFIIIIFLLTLVVYFYKILLLNSFTKLGENLNKGYKNIYQGVQEYFDGFKELYVLNRYSYFENKILSGTNEVANSDIKQSIIAAIPKLMIELTIVILMVGIVSYTIFIGEAISNIIPLLTLFAAASIRLAPMFNQVSRFFSIFSYGQDSILKLYDEIFIEQKLTINEKVSNINIKFKNLELKKISYKYPKSETRILDNVSLKINAGETIAISGPSGSGKTTLVDIILGLLQPESGEIFFNDNLIKEHSLTNMVAYLPQEIFLVNDTIKNNVALGSNNKDINHQKVIDCLNQAQLSSFIEEQKNGIETLVGEKGINLSGGQKQRIALARAFYYDREIIVFDEATSALDSEIEKEIVNQINLLKGNKTVIMISHNANTIKYCNIIFDIPKNRIIDE